MAAVMRALPVPSREPAPLSRSKACITCRRRKVKCDEGKPSCKRCLFRGSPCEGYDTQPMLALKTQRALLKRWRPGAGESSQREHQHVFAVSVSDNDLRPPRQTQRDETVTVPSVIHSPGTIESRFFGLFLDDYWPTRLADNRSYNPWLCESLDIQDAQLTPTLNASLRAVAMTRVGRARDDPVITAEGKNLYVKALRGLQGVRQPLR